MSLMRIHEFVFEDSLFSKEGYSLEIGSKSMLFANIMLSKGFKHIIVEPDQTVLFPSKNNLIFINEVLVGDESMEEVDFIITNDTLTHHLNNVGFNFSYNDVAVAKVRVKATTIGKIMQRFRIPQFELIAMDCEGAEEQIILSLREPIAKQLSIEFHTHCGQPVASVENMARHLTSIGYFQRHRWIVDSIVEYQTFTI